MCPIKLSVGIIIIRPVLIELRSIHTSPYCLCQVLSEDTCSLIGLVVDIPGVHYVAEESIISCGKLWRGTHQLVRTSLEWTYSGEPSNAGASVSNPILPKYHRPCPVSATSTSAHALVTRVGISYHRFA